MKTGRFNRPVLFCDEMLHTYRKRTDRVKENKTAEQKILLRCYHFRSIRGRAVELCYDFIRDVTENPRLI